MYNPQVYDNRGRGYMVPSVVVLTLGTNHVYILNETGEIVDNCRKRPAWLFTEKELTLDECLRNICRIR